VDFKPYQIVGVCNPRFAYRALSADDSIRLLLLYIFVLMEESDGVVVRIQNPEVMFSVVDEITKASLVGFPQEVKRSLQAELLALKYRGLTERFLP
jgi:uncharacterized protein (DUF302 family)